MVDLNLGVIIQVNEKKYHLSLRLKELVILSKQWLKEQWLYGEKFLDYLAKKQQNKNEGQSNAILTKVGNKKRLAQVAIDWFWDRHANNISVQKKLLEEISVPI